MIGREATEVMTVTEFKQERGYVTDAESCGAHDRAETALRGSLRKSPRAAEPRSQPSRAAAGGQSL